MIRWTFTLLALVLAVVAEWGADEDRMGGAPPGHRAGVSPSAPLATMMETAMTVTDDGVKQAPMTGIPVPDNQNVMTAGPRGPLLVRDWQLSLR